MWPWPRYWRYSRITVHLHLASTGHRALKERTAFHLPGQGQGTAALVDLLRLFHLHHKPEFVWLHWGFWTVLCHKLPDEVLPEKKGHGSAISKHNLHLSVDACTTFRCPLIYVLKIINHCSGVSFWWDWQRTYLCRQRHYCSTVKWDFLISILIV